MSRQTCLHDHALRSNLAHHTTSSRRGYASALRSAAEEWQQRHGVARVLTMGFLSGAQPIVDMYELKVGLLASVVCWA